MKHMKKIVCAVLALAFAFTLTACSSNNDVETKPGENSLEKITVYLDYTPNTNHTGLFVALAKGFYKDAMLDVEIIQPPENEDAISACSAGKVQFAVGYQDLLAAAFASETPMQVTAVAAILQHNSSCVMTKAGAGMDNPKGLEGNEFLTWESPIELAMMENIVNNAGGDWSKVKLIPNTVTDEAQDVFHNPNHAIWVYYGWGVINANVNNIDVDTFFFKDLNPIFDYYSPVIVGNNDYLSNNPERAKAFLDATRKGYEYAIENPEESAQILIDSDETKSLVGSEEMVVESQKWMSEQYIADAENWGYIDPERWNGFYNWLNDENLVSNKLEENTGFTNEYL